MPSDPGNQAAINASDALISAFTHKGLPDKNIEMIGIP